MEDASLVILIDRVAGYALRYGNVVSDKPYSIDSGMRGSDATSVNSREVMRMLERNGFGIKLNDIKISQWVGTYSVGWSKITYQTLEMYIDGNRIVQAERCLGGECGWSGMVGSERKEVKSTHWSIRFVGAIELEEVAKCLSDVKDSFPKESS